MLLLRQRCAAVKHNKHTTPHHHHLCASPRKSTQSKAYGQPSPGPRTAQWAAHHTPHPAPSTAMCRPHGWAAMDAARRPQRVGSSLRRSQLRHPVSSDAALPGPTQANKAARRAALKAAAVRNCSAALCTLPRAVFGKIRSHAMHSKLGKTDTVANRQTDEATIQATPPPLTSFCSAVSSPSISV